MTIRLQSPVKKLIIISLALLSIPLGLLAYFELRAFNAKVEYSFVTNVTPNSATIVWVTDKPTKGTVKLNNGTTFYDDRDVQDSDQDFTTVIYENIVPDTRRTHHVTLRDLNPESEYTFQIKNGWFTYEQEENSFLTASISDELKNPIPVYGQVQNTSANPPDDGIVVVELADNFRQGVDKRRSLKISSPLEHGTYSLSLNNAYSPDRITKFLSAEGENYYLTVEVHAPGYNFAYHTIDNKRYQPASTLVLEPGNTQASYFDFQNNYSPKRETVEMLAQLGVSQALAQNCPSHCVGNCQGCNDGACTSYGCGYMEYCCGSQSPDGSNDPAKDACAGHCGNGKQDCEESGVDCGGGGCHTCGMSADGSQIGAPPAPTDKACNIYGGAGTKTTPNPVTNNCACAVDGVKNADESGIDCGGSYCPSCTDNAGSHCFNGQKDTNEDGVDCGGSCAVKCPSASAPAQEEGSACTNNGEVFACSDLKDWYCWCDAGKVNVHHRKDIRENYSTRPTNIPQESKLGSKKLYTKTGTNWSGAVGVNLATQFVPENLNTSNLGGGFLVMWENQDDINRWADAISKLPADRLQSGFTLTVRPCYGGSGGCAFRDNPEQFAEGLKKVHALLEAKGVKDVNLATTVGANEEETWPIPPEACGGNCQGDMQKLAQYNAKWMAEVYSSLGTVKNDDNFIVGTNTFNYTSPNLETYTKALEAELKKNGMSLADFDALYGNAYNMNGYHLGQSVMDHVNRADSLLPDLPMVLAEVGAFDTPENPKWDDAISRDEALRRLDAQMEEVINDDRIVKAYMFNPTLTNPDPEFAYAVVPQDRLDQYIEAGTPNPAEQQAVQQQPVPPREQPNTVVVPPPQHGGFDQKQVIEVPATPALNNSHRGVNLSELIFKASAQDSNTVTTSGIYTVEGAILTGGKFELSLILEEGVGSAEVKFFNDKNGNGTRDADEEFLGDSVKLKKTEDVMTYNLKKGWNLLAFPIVSELTDDSKELLAEINDQGGYVTHVSTYQDEKWYLYTERGDAVFARPMNILPGVGYFIKSEKDMTFVLRGQKLDGGAPVALKLGWNLVGISSSKDYTADSLIGAAKAQTINMDAVGQWKFGGYEGYVKDGSDVFGSDFAILEELGYFVRVNGGEGSTGSPQGGGVLKP